MSDEKKKPGSRYAAFRASGVELRKTDATNIAKHRNTGKAHVRIDDSKEPRFCEVKGRALWALLELDRAGINGITPIEHPAPRWSAYIFNLREIGIKIETVHEPHGGPYPGTHARYILRSSIEICDAFDANA